MAFTPQDCASWLEETFSLDSTVQAEPSRVKRNAWPILDHDFATKVWDTGVLEAPSNRPAPAALCQQCLSIVGYQDDQQIVIKQASLVNQCELCVLLREKAFLPEATESDSVTLTKSRSLLNANGWDILRFCADPKSALQNRNIQMGSPILPILNRTEMEAPKGFHLLLDWLSECDSKHECNRKMLSTIQHFRPTRLIYVADQDPDILKLVVRASSDYVVLSHCWGNPSTTEKARVSTSRDNVDERLIGFNLSVLPQSFQDAVRITRALGKEYLWIDSLCILQGDGGDWIDEARLMEEVFSSAYCTIAATSALNWNEGFLNCLGTPRYIEFLGSLGERIFVTEDTGDFDRDVLFGPLNQRAWVHQERALSRRMIHFTSEQTYWECGQHVRCENLMKIDYSQTSEYFLQDPEFPERLSQLNEVKICKALENIFEKYARCGLTNETDRPIAISSLLRRTENVLKSKGRYGVFERFMSPLLLWSRMSRLDVPLSPPVGNGPIPSWSWMAWSGPIYYFAPKVIQAAQKSELQMSEDGSSLKIKVRDLPQGKLGGFGGFFSLYTESGSIGTVWLDMQEPTDCTKCCVVGCEEQTRGLDTLLYVLIVKATKSGEYVRIGAGEVNAGSVSSTAETAVLV